MALDGSGKIYVAYGSTKLRKYDSSLSLQWTQTLTSTFGWVATDNTNVYVTDFTNKKVYKRLCSDGSAVTSWGSNGTGDGQFRQVFGIATDGTYVYVGAELELDRIQKLQLPGCTCRNGEALAAAPESFLRYRISPLTHLATFWWHNWGNSRLQRFSNTGTYQAEISTTDPVGIGIASGDILWVSDDSNNVITKWDETNVIDSPSGIAVNRTSGRVYVLTGDQCKYFTSAGVFESGFGFTGSGDGAFSGPTHIRVNQSTNEVHTRRGEMTACRCLMP